MRVDYKHNHILPYLFDIVIGVIGQDSVWRNKKLYLAVAILVTQQLSKCFCLLILLC